jgi:Fe-S oxidoreductase
MITRDERDTTRGRANALRLALSGTLPDGLANHDLAETLDLCLQCKGCKAECPSNVDLAKLKVETLHQVYKSSRVPLPALALAHLDRLYAMARLARPLANWTTRSAPARWLLEKLAGVDRRRVLPPLAPRTFQSWFREHARGRANGGMGDVVFFADCFTNQLAPAAGVAAVRVLEAAGYRVRLAEAGCCGRTAISKGVLDRARGLAERNVAALAGAAADGAWLVGCEPSCVLTFTDEYREFRLGPAAERVAERARLIDDFVADRALVPDLPLEPARRKVLLHGHCHQKAAVGTGGSAATLRRVPELEVRVLDSSCCGMAGSFGYELGHYELSRALAERVILPSCRAEPDAVLAAPGFSCRSQVHDLAGIEAVHPVELLAEALVDPTKRR